MKRLENLVPPPRRVPIDVYLKTLLGGTLQQIGWAVFTFGMLFVIIFIGHGRLLEGASKEIAFRGEIATTKGVVLSASATGSEVNEVDVVLFGYEYEVDEQKLLGESYFTGWRYDEGDSVTVEYLPLDPTFSRIKGGRWSAFSPWICLLLLLFPALGLLIALHALKTGVKSTQLLKSGILAYGEFVSKEPTNTTIWNGPATWDTIRVS